MGGGSAGRETEEGEVREPPPGCEACRTLRGRLVGGGGGAFALSDLGLPCCASTTVVFPSSSAFGESLPVSRIILESETN